MAHLLNNAHTTCNWPVADDFKQINDHFGHDAGDKVLKSMGHTLIQCKRGSDIAARFGGEEFIILLPDTTADGAL